MHVAVMMQKVPVAATGGTGMHVVLASVLEALLLGGHEVSACFLLEPGDQQRLAQRPQDVAAWQARGVRTTVIPCDGAPAARSRAGKLVRFARQLASPRPTDYYPGLAASARVRDELERIKPDVVIGHPVAAMAALRGLRVSPRLTIVGNLDHLVPRERWAATPLTPPGPFLAGALRCVASRNLFTVMASLLSDCEMVAANTLHHARWLRAHGVPACEYLPLVITDLAGADWLEKRRAAPRRLRPKLLMIGNLRGAATQPGLRLLATEVLPRLESRLGPGGFELHLVGRDALPPALVKPLRRPGVILRGYVEDADAEFCSADVLLVTTPSELGARTRIIMGASYGCSIVAHAANLAGTPEFVPGRDLLAAANGRGLADAVVEVLRSPAQAERLGRQARATYEREFSVQAAAPRFTALFERMAGRATPAIASS